MCLSVCAGAVAKLGTKDFMVLICTSMHRLSNMATWKCLSLIYGLDEVIS